MGGKMPESSTGLLLGLELPLTRIAIRGPSQQSEGPAKENRPRMAPKLSRIEGQIKELSGSCGSGCKSLRHGTNLHQKSQLIPIVPTLDNLAARLTQNCDAGHRDSPVSGWNSHELATVSHFCVPAHHHAIAGCDRVLD